MSKIFHSIDLASGCPFNYALGEAFKTPVRFEEWARKGLISIEEPKVKNNNFNPS